MFISFCILCKSKPSDVLASTIKSLFTDVEVPIICNFRKRFHSGPLFYDFRILLALFSFVPNFSRGSWLQGIVFIFGFRMCIKHILWTWVFKFSRSALSCMSWSSSPIYGLPCSLCAVLSFLQVSVSVSLGGWARGDDMGGELLKE